MPYQFGGVNGSIGAIATVTPAKLTASFWLKPGVGSGFVQYQEYPVLGKKLSVSSLAISLLWGGNSFSIALGVSAPNVSGASSDYSEWFNLSVQQSADLIANGGFFSTTIDVTELFIRGKRGRVFLGGVEITNTTLRNLPQPNTLPYGNTALPWDIGKAANPWSSLYYKGGLAEVALWSEVKTDAELILMAQGHSAKKYPTAMVFHLPLATDTNEWASNTNGAIAGDVTQSGTHPTVIQAVNPVRPTPPPPPDLSKTVRLFAMGNSVTDAAALEQLGLLAQSAGLESVYARQIIPGAPLETIISNNSAGFTTDPYGGYPNALPDYEWDAINLQPFDRPLTTDQASIQTLIDLGRTKSPNASWSVYGRWPRLQTAVNTTNYTEAQWRSLLDSQTAALWNTRWERSYNPAGSDQPEECRAYFEALVTTVRTANPNLAKPIRLIPVGEVFYQLNIKMAAGQVPGFNDIWDVYVDGIHLLPIGKYIACATFFSVLYRKSAIGLPVPSFFGAIPAAVKDKIQQTIDEVVVAKSAFTGIASFSATPSPSPTPTPSPTSPPSPTPSPIAPTPRQRNPYPLENVYPGQSRIIQLFNPDGTMYVIPTGATIEAKVVSVVGELIADLGAIAFDSSKGLVKLTLPDTPQVRKFVGGYGVYDVAIALFGGSIKYLPPSKLEIARSPTKFLSV